MRSKLSKNLKSVLYDMHNTLEVLSDKGLTHYHNNPIYEKREDKDWVTWPNHQPGRYNCETYFARIEQYKKNY